MSETQGKRGEKVQVDPLELNKETVEDLSESTTENVKGGVAATDVRSGNKCCSSPCVKAPIRR